MGKLVGLALSVLTVLGLLALPAAASDFQPDAEQGFLEAINGSRAEAGLAPVSMNTELAGIARDWTLVMDAEDTLRHNPSYAEQYSGGWTRMGENVGYATRDADNAEMVAVLHQAFMDSFGHRANILGDYNQVGIGAVRDGRTLWVTVNFLQGPVPVEDDASAQPDAGPGEDAEAAPEEAPSYVPPPSERRWGSR